MIRLEQNQFTWCIEVQSGGAVLLRNLAMSSVVPAQEAIVYRWAKDSTYQFMRFIIKIVSNKCDTIFRSWLVLTLGFSFFVIDKLEEFFRERETLVIKHYHGCLVNEWMGRTINSYWQLKAIDPITYPKKEINSSVIP